MDGAIRRTSTLITVAASCTLLASLLRAQGLPECRVRFVVSPEAAQSAPQNVLKTVESWVDVRDRGCHLAPTIDTADVLLELTQYRTKTLQDGTPGQEFWFIARRLAEPASDLGTYRFAYVITPHPKATSHVAKEIPTVLKDVCFGWLPQTTVH